MGKLMTTMNDDNGMKVLVPDYIKTLENRRIRYGDETTQKRDVFLWYQNETDRYPILGKNELMIITGREKSRKSTLASSIITSNYMKKPLYTLGYEMELDAPILIFDTEQTPDRTRLNFRKLIDLIGKKNDNDKLLCYNIRSYSYRQRIEIINYKIEEMMEKGTPPGLILIDVITDLIPGRDSNNVEAATEAMNYIVKWRDITNAAMIAIIHTNRLGEETTGKLGVILDQILDTSFLLKYNKKTEISTVEHKDSKDKRIPPFTFSHNEKGYPMLINQESGNIF